jgi:hypothetical protein
VRWTPSLTLLWWKEWTWQDLSGSARENKKPRFVRGANWTRQLSVIATARAGEHYGVARR